MEFIAAGPTTATDRRRPKVAALGQAADCRRPSAVRARRILLLLETESTLRHSQPLVLAMEKNTPSGYKSVLNCSIIPLAIEKSKMLAPKHTLLKVSSERGARSSVMAPRVRAMVDS